MVNKVEEVINSFRSILFPKFYGEGMTEELLYAQLCRIIDKKTASSMIDYLPELKEQLEMDVEAAYNGDPAAESYDEIICCYPVIKAMINYRVAHKMLSLGISLIPRIITEKAHSETGIDIHPAASIGHHFTIDHGTGVVIGATCIIGNNVKLYQGVTLGAKSFPLDEKGNPIKGIPRHPIIEDDVIIYSNSTVLGRITIGRGSIIGGNLWVTKGTEPGEKLMQNDKTKS
jgi:serine O-acetyltransferase